MTLAARQRVLSSGPNMTLLIGNVRSNAMVILMFRKGLFSDAAQLRLGIESLGPDVYEKLSYYERWAASAAHQALARGVVTAEELEARVEKLRLEGAQA